MPLHPPGQSRLHGLVQIVRGEEHIFGELTMAHHLFAGDRQVNVTSQGVSGRCEPDQPGAGVAGVGLSFEVATSGAVKTGPWDAIAIVDMLYLLPAVDQRALLTAAAAQLAPGGLLLFSTNAQRFRLAAAVSERWAVRDISAATIPFDFKRSPRIHRAYELRA